MGVSVRFQRNIKNWFGSFWKKTYPSKVSVGVNSLTYEYKQLIKPYVNPMVFGDIFYTWKGVNYHSNGTQSSVGVPKIQFPLSKLISGNVIYITIVDFLRDNPVYNLNMTDKQIIKKLNDEASNHLVKAIKSIPAYYGATGPSANTTAAIFNINKNGTKMTIFNQGWERTGDNNITKYIDVTVPTIGITTSADSNFLVDPKIKYPTPMASNYKSGAVDIYGGAYYQGKWYGARLISADYE